MIEQFKKYNIEYRPLVAGNLLRQPFLKDYTFGYEKDVYNADIIHEYGMYVGNSQFIGPKHIKLLSKILSEVSNHASS